MAQSSEIEKLERRWADNPLGLTFAPLAEAYRRAGDHPRALEVLEIGLARHEAYVPALIVRARCHLDAGLDSSAEESFRGVLATDAHNLIALKGLADICERGGRLEETRGHLDRLLEADPTHDDARTQYARVSLAIEARPLDVDVNATPAAGSFAAPDVVTDEAPEIVAGEFIELGQAWVAPEFELPPEGESPILEGGVATATPSESAEADPSGNVNAETAPELDQVAAAPGGASDLVIEREIRPFEGFDPATWDLPFGDATPPDRPFEESSPLAPISLEQEYEAASLAEEAGALAGEAPVWNDLVLERSDGSGIADDVPEPMAPVGAEESSIEVATPAAEVSENAWHVEPAEAPHEPMAVMEESTQVEEIAGEPVVTPLGPMDIPEFISWEEDAAPVEEAPVAEPIAGQPVWSGFTAPDTPEQAVVTPISEPDTTSDREAWATAEVGELAHLESPEPELPPAPVEAMEEPAPAGELPLAEGFVAEAVTEPADAWPAWDGPGETIVLATEAEDAVVVVEGALEETPVDAEQESATFEPELVITETMADVFLRQGHKPLALAVYAQLLERDAGNSRLVEAVAKLRAELLPQPTADAAPSARDGSGSEEPVGAFLARVLGPAAAGGDAAASPAEDPAGARPTQPSTDQTLDLSTIFGEETPRAGRARPATPAPRGEGEPSFDEFFGGTGGGAGVVAGAGGEEEDLEQFNAWLRSLSR